MTTSPPSVATPPTDDDVAAYREHGWWVSPPIVPEDVLDRALDGMERFYAGDRDAPFPGHTRWDHTDWVPAHGDGLRKNDYASLQVGELGDLVRHPAIAATAARLAGAGEIRLWHDQLLHKPPGGDEGHVGWHTDRQYWESCTSTQMLTAWVPLVDVDERLGTITFVDGSHRWPEGLAIGFFDGDLAAQEARMAAAGLPVRKVAPALRRGQVTFHHCRTVHGSGPNRGDRPRRSLAIHLQPGDNRHQPGYHRNDELVRRVDGVPDYTDPRICPRLHPPGHATAPSLP